MRTEAALTNREQADSPQSLTFIQGCKSAIPIAVGYIPIAIAFGLLAKSSGVPNYISMMMSFFIFAGASQFVGANLLAVGAAYGEIVLTTFILNLRHFLMTASIAQRVEEGVSKKWMALLAFGVTDETFTVAALREESRLPKEFVLGLNMTSFAAWNVGTWVGVFLAAGLPASIQESMGIALYAMFIGLLVPSLRTSRPVLIVCILSISIHSLLYWVPVFTRLSTGWRIIISTILAAGIGAVLFSEEGNKS